MALMDTNRSILDQFNQGITRIGLDPSLGLTERSQSRQFLDELSPILNPVRGVRGGSKVDGSGRAKSDSQSVFIGRLVLDQLRRKLSASQFHEAGAPPNFPQSVFDRFLGAFSNQNPNFSAIRNQFPGQGPDLAARGRSLVSNAISGSTNTTNPNTISNLSRTVAPSLFGGGQNLSKFSPQQAGVPQNQGLAQPIGSPQGINQGSIFDQVPGELRGEVKRLFSGSQRGRTPSNRLGRFRIQ